MTIFHRLVMTGMPTTMLNTDEDTALATDDAHVLQITSQYVHPTSCVEEPMTTEWVKPPAWSTWDQEPQSNGAGVNTCSIIVH